jgi:hypothetical protein
MESEIRPFPGQPAGRRRKEALAIDPSLGAVFLCHACRQIHLQFGDLHARVDTNGFHALVVLLNRAAANFELWAGHEGSAA